MSDIQEELDKINYSYKFLLAPKWLIGSGVIFFLIIVLQFPAKDKVDQLIYSSLTNIPGCPIQFSDYRFELFAPKLVFNNINIQGECFKKPGEPIKLKELKVYIRGLSFSPLGASFKVVTRLKNTLIEAKIVPGISSLSVLMENDGEEKSNIIKLSDFASAIPAVELDGDINITNLYLSMGYNGKIKDLTANLASKNFAIPAQTIQFVGVKNLQINNFLLQVMSLKNGKYKIKKFILGDDKSPIIAEFSGELKPNLSQVKKTYLNISGELAFSDKFMKDYSIVNIFLGQFDKKDKFYQIQAKGSLSSLKYSSPR